MDLGTFSTSLAVKDLEASRAFYEALGFAVFGGSVEHRMLMMRNGTTVVGLFQGMFERNMLTFNPGWAADCSPLDGFTDVREIQRRLRERGIEPVAVVDESTTGPGSIVVVDPDGNPVLLDQHV